MEFGFEKWIIRNSIQAEWEIGILFPIYTLFYFQHLSTEQNFNSAQNYLVWYFTPIPH
jgi:hypothetical protein